MAKTLNQAELLGRNLWLKYVLFAGKNGDANNFDRKIVRSKDNDDSVYEDVAKATLLLWDVVCSGKFLTIGLDDAIRTGTTVSVTNPKTLTIYEFEAEDVASYIASLCKDNKLTWDDIVGMSRKDANGRTTPYSIQEVNRFKDKTLLGKALTDFECFRSQTDPEAAKKAAAAQAPAQSDSNATAPAAKPASAQPTPAANPASAQSAPAASKITPAAGSSNQLYASNCPGITNHNKEYLSGKVYWIKGDFENPAAKTSVRINISPRNATDLKVKYTSGNGGEDCILYFATELDANNFKAIIEPLMPTSGPKAISKLYLRQTNADPNGYLEVNTNHGKAYILASKLHEELEEEIVGESIDDIVERYRNVSDEERREALEYGNYLLGKGLE